MNRTTSTTCARITHVMVPRDIDLLIHDRSSPHRLRRPRRWRSERASCWVAMHAGVNADKVGVSFSDRLDTDSTFSIGSTCETLSRVARWKTEMMFSLCKQGSRQAWKNSRWKSHPPIFIVTDILMFSENILASEKESPT